MEEEGASYEQIKTYVNSSLEGYGGDLTQTPKKKGGG